MGPLWCHVASLGDLSGNAMNAGDATGTAKSGSVRRAQTVGKDHFSAYLANLPHCQRPNGRNETNIGGNDCEDADN